MAQQEYMLAGCSKSPSSKAAASEEARRTLRYVEPLSAARTPLVDFFSILLEYHEVLEPHPGVKIQFGEKPRYSGLDQFSK